MWTDQDSQKLRDALLAFDPAFKSSVDAGYHWLQTPDRLSRFYIREIVSYLSETYRDPAILDYGCGVATMMLYLWRNGYTRVEGRDANPHVVEAAQRMLREFDAPLKVMGVTLEDVYAIRGRWDVVLMNDWLYFGADLIRIAEGLRGNLTPNGLWAFDLLDFETPMKGGRRYYTVSDIQPMLEAHGFRLAGHVVLDQKASRKTLYFARLVSPAGSVLSPGNLPYV